MSTSTGELSYRLARDEDLPSLRQYRIECGWGVERLNRFWGDENRPLCVFSIDMDGQTEDVGMAGWLLESEDEPELASRSEGNVEITSLFIRAQHQRKGLGKRAMDILERVAVDLYAARAVTLDTHYWIMHNVDGGFIVEDKTKINPTIDFYQRRGYKLFGEPVPRYAHPAPDDPHQKIVAVFLSKSAEQVIRDQQGGDGGTLDVSTSGA